MADDGNRTLTGPERIERLSEILQDLATLNPSASEMRMVIEMGAPSLTPNEVDDAVTDGLQQLRDAR